MVIFESTIMKKSTICKYCIRAVICFSFLTVSNNSNAQDSLFNKRYGGASGESIADIIQLPCDEYLVIGSSSSFSASNDFLLMKIDAGGDVIWTKTYGGADRDLGRRIIPVSGGNYLLIGITLSWGPGIPSNDNNLLVKIDGSGNVLWAKVYGTTNRQRAVDAIEDINGDYIIGAWNAPGDDPLIFKVKGTTGNLIWDELVMDNTGDNQIEEVIPTPSGLGCIIIGSASNTGSGGSWEPYIGEVDNNGVLVWAKYVSGGGSAEQTKRGIRTIESCHFYHILLHIYLHLYSQFGPDRLYKNFRQHLGLHSTHIRC